MLIAERFISVQGEGASVGYPAYFIRMTGCNLRCGGTGGELVKSGQATWNCDSDSLWRSGIETSIEDILKDWNRLNITDGIIQNRIHVVWTGGEPTLKKNADFIVSFIDYFEKLHGDIEIIYNEIETNGTIFTCDYNGFNFYRYFQQINCSPKLANSGLAKEDRIVPKAIKQIMNCDNFYFKFVISEEKDIVEIKRDFIEPFEIPEESIILMPGVYGRDELPERTRFIYEMAKKYQYRAITRNHIIAYDKRTGV